MKFFRKFGAETWWQKVCVVLAFVFVLAFGWSTGWVLTELVRMAFREAQADAKRITALNVEWEILSPVELRGGRGVYPVHRTRVPEGWLVVVDGNAAVVVSDSMHTWGSR